MVVNFYDQWMTNDVFHVGETISQTTHDWEWWGHGGVMVTKKPPQKMVMTEGDAWFIRVFHGPQKIEELILEWIELDEMPKVFFTMSVNE